MRFPGFSFWHYIGKLYECESGPCTKHIFAGEKRIASKTGTKVRYYHTDHLGSSNIVTESDEASPEGYAVQTAFYYPFGETLESIGNATSYKFTGQEEDPETGLYYYGARYYDQKIGRFISPDPIMQAAFDPGTFPRTIRHDYTPSDPPVYALAGKGTSASITTQGMISQSAAGIDLMKLVQNLNTYSYTANNPVNAVDPLGLDLILVGQGGKSGGLFLLAAQTWVSQNPGAHTLFQVSSGQQAIQAMQAYAQSHGSIDGLQVFSHSGNQGIFLNQSVGAESLYIDMPSNPGAGASSLADISASWFGERADVKLWGCYTGYGENSFAQKLANQIGVDVTGAIGPTAFTGVPNGTPGQGLPRPVPNNYQPVYMVPQYPDQGYSLFSPQSTPWYQGIFDLFGSW